MHLAAIDMGTNSFHMVVADVDPSGAFEIVAAEKEMLRLGDDVARNMHLSAERMDAAVACMARFAAMCSSWGVRRTIACATSAIREADNGADLCDRVEAETGINPRVISGLEEADLIYRALRHTAGVPGDHLVGVDIGGGSVELMLGDDRELHWSASLHLGVARVAAEAGIKPADPPARKDRARLVTFLESRLAESATIVRQRRFDRVVGSSGTIEDLARTLATNGKAPIPPSIDGHRFSRAALAALDQKLWKMATAERRALPGIDPRRADIIHFGSTLLLTILDSIGAGQMSVSTWALREGILLASVDDLAGEAVPLDRETQRRDSVLGLLRRCNADEWHARHVARLATELFDAAHGDLKAASSERLLLEEAALLHDIGNFVSTSGHHRHTEYLVQNAGIRGASPDEVRIVAAVARSHRGSGPKDKHDSYGALGPAQRKVVDRLSALLRIADGLDRGHGQQVTKLVTKIDRRAFVVEVDGPDSPDLEVWGARRKRDMLEKLLGRPVEIVQSGSSRHPVGRR